MRGEPTPTYRPVPLLRTLKMRPGEEFGAVSRGSLLWCQVLRTEGTLVTARVLNGWWELTFDRTLARQGRGVMLPAQPCIVRGGNYAFSENGPTMVFYSAEPQYGGPKEPEPIDFNVVYYVGGRIEDSKGRGFHGVTADDYNGAIEVIESKLAEENARRTANYAEIESTTPGNLTVA